MDKIFSPIKQRIVLYIEKQGIKKEDFYKKTGISASNFKGKGGESEIGGDKIAKILSLYSNINPEWLLLGNGEMIRTIQQDQNISQEYSNPNDVIFLLKEQLQEAKEEIKKLNREIGMLQNQNSQLRSGIKDFGQEIITEPPGLSRSSILPSTDVDSAGAHL